MIFLIMAREVLNKYQFKQEIGLNRITLKDTDEDYPNHETTFIFNDSYYLKTYWLFCKDENEKKELFQDMKIYSQEAKEKNPFNEDEFEEHPNIINRTITTPKMIITDESNIGGEAPSLRSTHKPKKETNILNMKKKELVQYALKLEEDKRVTHTNYKKMKSNNRKLSKQVKELQERLLQLEEQLKGNQNIQLSPPTTLESN